MWIWTRICDSEFLKRISDSDLMKKMCEKTEFLHKLQAQADINYTGISSMTRSPINISSG